QEAGRLFGLDPQFIAAIIKVESNFDHLAVSSKGAQGAMQIMPGTQAQLGLKDPFDVQANIHAGCAFIRELLLQYGSTELALAAYNAGPGAVDKYGGIPPYAETQNYVRRVMALWQGEERQNPPAADGGGARSGTDRAMREEDKKDRRSRHGSRKKRGGKTQKKSRKNQS
ncbi:MAG: lytic transglycosylase domain-containing protein, partial [Desulfovibrio sp.]|nr:lytic transglycosylase domain-containing protein [Desulfovibrio sp.]